MKKLIAVISMVISLIGLAGELRADAVSTCSHASATMLPVSAAGVPLEITGMQIPRADMARLWEITTTRSDAYLYLGKVIGEGQNWFGACKFPGLGLVTGSGGGDWMRRYVALWVWADGVDMDVARSSIYSLIAGPTTTTTTSTTTTTTTSTTTTTTTTTAPTTTTMPPETTTTTAATVAAPTTTTTTATPTTTVPPAPEPTTTATVTTMPPTTTTTTAAATSTTTTMVAGSETPVTLGIMRNFTVRNATVQSAQAAQPPQTTVAAPVGKTLSVTRAAVSSPKPKLKIVKLHKKAKVVVRTWR